MPQLIPPTQCQAAEEGHGGACNIVVTQPRRISAIGRGRARGTGEGRGPGRRGGLLRAPRLARITPHPPPLLHHRQEVPQHACPLLNLAIAPPDHTPGMQPGVLLRRLLSDSSLEGTTHIVVDEVHERSVDSDLLLLLLRDLLASGANSKLRLLLMSATADADLFQRYFDASLSQVGGLPAKLLLHLLTLFSDTE